MIDQIPYELSLSLQLIYNIMANTVKIARKLNFSGVQWDQAQTHAEVINDAVDDALGEVATKDFVENRLGQQDSKMDTIHAQLDSKMDANHAQLDSKMDANHAQLDSKMDTNHAQLDSKMEKGFSEVRVEAAEVRTEVKSAQLTVTRWIIATGISISSLLIALGTLIIRARFF